MYTSDGLATAMTSSTALVLTCGQLSIMQPGNGSEHGLSPTTILQRQLLISFFAWLKNMVVSLTYPFFDARCLTCQFLGMPLQLLLDCGSETTLLYGLANALWYALNSKCDALDLTVI